MKILLAVDGSATTKRMLAYVAAHDEFLGAKNEFIAVTVVPPLPGRVASFLPGDTIESWHAEQAEQVLKPVRDFAAMNGWNLRERQFVGHAGQQIAHVAEEEKVDLVMMGSHGHTALGNVVMGSVATSVLANCKLPVLLVR